MIKYREIDLLKSECNIICHQVNCQGVIGSGIALQIKNNYPKVYEDYIKYCLDKTPDQLLGNVVYSATRGECIANLFGQKEFGRNGLFTDYSALNRCFRNVKTTALQIKDILDINIIHVGAPYKIGCDRGGGDWNIVEKMLKDLFEDEVDVVLEICKL